MKKINSLPSPIGISREEIMALLLREEYGVLPASPFSVTATEVSCDKKFCAARAELLTLTLHCKAEFGEFSFPLYYARPTRSGSPVPCFIHINFRDLIPDRYQPTEEIIDKGYATLTFCYKDVSSDDGDFSNGLAGVVYPDGKQTSDGCGKIGLWAWAACAVLEYALTLPELDHSKISVVGHSRLGKTALLAGALDSRFFCAFSNNSGCGGAALSRSNTGETVRKITDRFPYWFCKSFKQYADNEEALTFDQHFLLAANAPHKVYVASAEEDLWACPDNEYLSCVEASAYYEALGISGFEHPDRMPKVGESFHGGNIGYHIRSGCHYLSREDWNRYIEFLSK
ncbi:MAG: acetylxylan esterase [Clostridia bacterium]|nr:acetylxylan esterase [Clostridia bacterium]